MWIDLGLGWPIGGDGCGCVADFLGRGVAFQCEVDRQQSQGRRTSRLGLSAMC